MSQNTIRTIIGRKGSGKTELAKKSIIHRDKPCLIVDLFDQFQPYPIYLSSKNLLTGMIETNFSIYRPFRIAIYNQDEFDIVCQIVKAHKNMIFVVDEVDIFDRPTNNRTPLKELIHYGRLLNIDIVTTSRRPANISRDLTSQTDQFCIFRTTEKRDLDYFEELNPALPDMIRALPDFHYIQYDHKEIVVMSPVALC